MWTCPKCKRIFQRKDQPHSCESIPLEAHFENKTQAKDLFDFLYKEINSKIGKSKIISIPCCIHLYGRYDFLAVLPKKDGIEIRFGLNRILESPRITQAVKVTQKSYKNCINIKSRAEIDAELLSWIKEAYFLK